MHIHRTHPDRPATDPDRHPTYSDWLAAPTVTSPAQSPEGGTLAYVSDADGLPRLWLAPKGGSAGPVQTGPDQVRAVSWSPDGQWLCLLTAPAGGERTRVRALRPDGSDQRVIAGTPTGAAVLGRWQPGGHVVGLAETSADEPGELAAFAMDVETGRRRFLARGVAAAAAAFSHDGRYAVVRVGRRAHRRLLLVDLRAGERTELLRGNATVADACFAPDDRTIYLHSDAGREFAALLAAPRIAAGYPDAAEVVLARDGVELECWALDPTGRAAAVVWNVDGCSELELVELDGGARRAVRFDAQVVTGCGFAYDGSALVLAVESAAEPAHVLRLPLRASDPPRPRSTQRLVPAVPPWPLDTPTRPTLHRWSARDGLELTGWLYRPPRAADRAATLVWLHGGPEAQHRPTFDPLFQALLDGGIAVFAPNVRGSSGYGHRFVDADNLDRRFAAIDDVESTAEFLVSRGLADPARLACGGRSYGGWLTLAVLLRAPGLFRVGVDVCGITDFATFYAHTEPWIAAAATGEYGDPQLDAALLRDLSPLHRIAALTVPLLVVHGAHDTNVPLVEALQVVAALRVAGTPPRLLQFDDEGHELRGRANRAEFVAEVRQWLTHHLLAADDQLGPGKTSTRR